MPDTSEPRGMDPPACLQLSSDSRTLFSPIRARAGAQGFISRGQAGRIFPRYGFGSITTGEEWHFFLLAVEISTRGDFSAALAISSRLFGHTVTC